jgi:hypothetical protein
MRTAARCVFKTPRLSSSAIWGQLVNRSKWYMLPVRTGFLQTPKAPPRIEKKYSGGNDESRQGRRKRPLRWGGVCI